jgi:hypothetical protein
MRNEIVQAAREALGSECRIPDEEFSSRLGDTLDEFQALAGLQKAIGPPAAVRKHWRNIERHLRALLAALNPADDEAKIRLIRGGLWAAHMSEDNYETLEERIDRSKANQPTTADAGAAALCAFLIKEHQYSRYDAQVSAAFQQYAGFVMALLDFEKTASVAAKQGGHRIPGRHDTGGAPSNKALDTAIAKLAKLYEDATGERAQSGITYDPITGETTGRFIIFATVSLWPLENDVTPGMLRARASRLLPPTHNSRKKIILRVSQRTRVVPFVPSVTVTTRGDTMPKTDEKSPKIDQELAARLMRLLDDQPAELPKLDRLVSVKQFCEIRLKSLPLAPLHCCTARTCTAHPLMNGLRRGQRVLITRSLFARGRIGERSAASITMVGLPCTSLIAIDARRRCMCARTVSSPYRTRQAVQVHKKIGRIGTAIRAAKNLNLDIGNVPVFVPRRKSLATAIKRNSNVVMAKHVEFRCTQTI